MANLLTKPRGTLDTLPADSWKWQYVENTMRAVLARFGFAELRTPTFEATELFARGVGDTTDIVNKEMYTFLDKGGRSMTLRPEGTAGAVRAVLENGLLSSAPLPLKAYYIESCFRYEKAQKGRYREFHQMGIECFGTHEAAADVEVISVAAAVLRELGLVKGVELRINSIGCPKCRPAFHAALREYFSAHMDDLCGLCHGRFEKNPMRILDCKEEKCHTIAAGAPIGLDYLCGDCREHFEQVKALLAGDGLAFTIDPHVVRGLDYYTNTVFEFVSAVVGTQGTICGGGRYDGLVGMLGGPETPGVGFGMGLERTLLALEEFNVLPAPPKGPALYAVGADEDGRRAARQITRQLRSAGFAVEQDLSARSVKAQMKAANRLGAQFTTVLGGAEVESGKAVFKNMETGAEVPYALADVESAMGEAMFALTAAAFDNYFGGGNAALSEEG